MTLESETEPGERLLISRSPDKFTEIVGLKVKPTSAEYSTSKAAEGREKILRKSFFRRKMFRPAAGRSGQAKEP